MQRKLNLSFLTLLMTISFLIKTTNAEIVVASGDRSQRAVSISEQPREMD
ncbi:hypothetical protein O9A_00766 [Bartonella koehlerae C-29]|uniref:Uncharacterized protein n=1 Tax=Bartonella koehlerae C-29 TaxID=1134510 RepID=A0A067W9F6_9HYPH|nr:hypothetical protein O9A_00766 [Bartonella koehlerae C-29]